jgi:hypothetical protein
MMRGWLIDDAMPIGGMDWPGGSLDLLENRRCPVWEALGKPCLQGLKILLRTC